MSTSARRRLMRDFKVCELYDAPLHSYKRPGLLISSGFDVDDALLTSAGL